MVLYLSIVLLATLTALPKGTEVEAGEHAGGGVHGLGLISLIWGTTIGLALAHWFAFRLTAKAFGGGQISTIDVQAGLAQMAGAALLALLCTIPVLLVDESDDVAFTTWVPAVVVAIAGYLVARVSGRTRTGSVILGVVAMIVGITVAATKNFLLGH